MAGRGRPRKPTKLRAIEGNRGKRPLNTSEPEPRQPEGPPPAPDYLTDPAREEWQRVAPELHRLGILTVVDLSTLAAYCASYARFVEAVRALREEKPTIVTSNGNTVQNPLVGVANSAAKQMTSYANELGMTPAGRAKLSVQPGQPKFDI